MVYPQYIVAARQLGLLLLMLLFAAVAAMPTHAAEESAVQVEVLPAAREVAPGAVTTVAFRLTNDEAAAYRVGMDATLPEGWQLVVAPREVVVEPAEEKVLLLHVRVSAHALPGAYQLLVAFIDLESGRQIQQEPVSVVVLPVHGLELRLQDVPSFMKAGVTYEASLVLTNQGNAAASAQLDADLSTWAVVRFGEEAPALGAWESRRLAVQVTPKMTTDSGKRTLVVRARRDAGEDVVQSSEVVELIAAPGNEADQRASFPVRLGVGAVGGSRGSGLQFSLAGRGSPWQGAPHDVDFSFHMPDRRAGSFIGARDEYRLGIRSARWSVRLGDQVYALSPLTEMGRFGFGASGSVQVGEATLGALYGRNRFSVFDDTQYGAYANYAVGRSTEVGVQLFGREGQGAGEALTVRGVTRAIPGMRLDIEAGSGGGGIDGAAYGLQLAGRHSLLSYEARLMHAGSEFVGIHRGTDLRQVRVGLLPHPSLRLEGSWQDFSQARGHDVIEQNRTYQIGAGIDRRLSDGQLHLRLQFDGRENRHAFGQVVQERTVKSVRLQSGLSRQRGSLMGMAEWGQTESRVAGGAFRSYSVQAQLNLPDVQLTASAARRVGMLPYARQEQNAWTLNAGLNARLGAHTQLSVHGTAIRHGVGQTSVLASARLGHMFHWGHEVSLQAQHRAFGTGLSGQEATEFGVVYTLPLGIPVPSRRVGSDVTGRVYDAETGAPIENAVLRMGEALALSDGNGRFKFGRIKNGLHLLNVNPASLGLGRTVLQGMSIAIEVAGNDVSGVEVAVVRSATISGRVIRYEEPPRRLDESEQPAAVEVGGQSGAVLELADGEERLHLVTDGQGRFRASGLRPGGWVLRVVSGHNPAEHSPAQEEYRLELAPGSDEQFDIKLLPRTRQLKVIESGAVQLE